MRTAPPTRTATGLADLPELQADSTSNPDSIRAVNAPRRLMATTSLLLPPPVSSARAAAPRPGQHLPVSRRAPLGRGWRQNPTGSYKTQISLVGVFRAVPLTLGGLGWRAAVSVS